MTAVGSTMSSGSPIRYWAWPAAAGDVAGCAAVGEVQPQFWRPTRMRLSGRSTAPGRGLAVAVDGEPSNNPPEPVRYRQTGSGRSTVLERRQPRLQRPDLW